MKRFRFGADSEIDKILNKFQERRKTGVLRRKEFNNDLSDAQKVQKPIYKAPLR